MGLLSIRNEPGFPPLPFFPFPPFKSGDVFPFIPSPPFISGCGVSELSWMQPIRQSTVQVTEYSSCVQLHLPKLRSNLTLSRSPSPPGCCEWSEASRVSLSGCKISSGQYCGFIPHGECDLYARCGDRVGHVHVLTTLSRASRVEIGYINYWVCCGGSFY